jgi:hypothetical protein
MGGQSTQLVIASPPETKTTRKCRWCGKSVEASPKGMATLWKHARTKHATELEAADWPKAQPA